MVQGVRQGWYSCVNMCVVRPQWWGQCSRALKHFYQYPLGSAYTINSESPELCAIS